MSENSGGKPIVHLSNHSAAALSEPRFIVRVGDVYYVTLAAWAYDASKAQTDEHKAGCDEIARQFRLSEPVEARIPPTREPFGATHTDPADAETSGGSGSDPSGGKTG